MNRRGYRAHTGLRRSIHLDDSYHMNLTPQQREQIAATERASFMQMCKRAGVPSDEYERGALRGLQREVEQTLQALMAWCDTDGGESGFDEILRTSDFWVARRLVTESRRASIVDNIIEAVDELPINDKYVDRLARALSPDECTPKQSVGHAVRVLLRLVPTISLFGGEFNARVWKESVFDGMPCVCVYETLHATVAWMANVLTLALVRGEPAQGVWPANAAACAQVATDPSHMELCHKSFDLVAGTALTIQGPIEYTAMSEQSPEWTAIHRLIEAGAQGFVWYHEFGHLLLGHFDRRPSHDIENEADSFAFSLLHHQFSEDGWLEWGCFGAVITMFTLVVLEASRGQRHCSSHPPAETRLRRLLSWAEEHVDSKVVSELARNLAIVCNPTLEQKWGFSVAVN